MNKPKPDLTGQGTGGALNDPEAGGGDQMAGVTGDARKPDHKPHPNPPDKPHDDTGPEGEEG